MKLATIRKILIKQTIIVIIVIAIVAAPVFYADYIYDEYDTKSKDIESQGNSIASQVSTLSGQYENVNNKFNEYTSIKDKQDKKMLTVSKVVLRTAFADIRKKYNFNKFDVEMTDVKPKIGGQYKLNTIFSEDSNVTIKLDSISDEDVFNLIKELNNSFSAVKFTSIKIVLSKNFDPTTLLEIKNVCFSPLVTAEIAFIWSGLQNVKKDDVESLTEKASPEQAPARRVRLRPAQ